MLFRSIRDLGDVAHMTENIRKTGTANTSNTVPAMMAEFAKSGLEHGINLKAGGIPIATWARRGAQEIKHKIGIKESLKPEAGIAVKKKLSEIGK